MFRSLVFSPPFFKVCVFFGGKVRSDQQTFSMDPSVTKTVSGGIQSLSWASQMHAGTRVTLPRIVKSLKVASFKRKSYIISIFFLLGYGGGEAAARSAHCSGTRVGSWFYSSDPHAPHSFHLPGLVCIRCKHLHTFKLLKNIIMHMMLLGFIDSKETFAFSNFKDASTLQLETND